MRKYLLLFLLLTISISSSSLYGQHSGPKYKKCDKCHFVGEPYFMSVQALKGMEETEVIVGLATRNPVEYPIPSELKKLQIKIKDAEEEVDFIVNEKNAAIIDGQVRRNVSEPVFHDMLHVKALNQIGGKILVTQEEAKVLLRPDLSIMEVLGPNEVEEGDLFDLTITVRELNTELGGLFDLALLINGELYDVMEGLVFDPSDIVDVTFENVSIAEEGEYTIEAIVNNVRPTDYDISNNALSFPITVLSSGGILPSTYDIDYHRTYNWYKFNSTSKYKKPSSSYYWTRTSYSFSREEKNWESLNFMTYLDGILEGESLNLNFIANQFELYDQVIPKVFSSEDRDEYRTFPINGMTIKVWSFFTGQNAGTSRIQLTKSTSYRYYINSSGSTSIKNHSTTPIITYENSFPVTIEIRGNNKIGGGSTIVNCTNEGRRTIRNITRTTTSWSWGWHYKTVIVDRYWYDSKYSHQSGDLDQSGLVFKETSTHNNSISALIPEKTTIRGNYPNPFNPSTTIQYDLRDNIAFQIDIFNILGSHVKTLVQGNLPPGSYSARWDGTNSNGEQVNAGIYFVRLHGKGLNETHKIVLVK